MTSKLHTDLIRLHECVSSETSGNAEEALEIARNIFSFCRNDIENADLVAVVSLLFKRNGGILDFLQKTTLLTQFQDCKSILLDCLLWLLENKVETKILQSSYVQQHALDIKNVVVRLYIRDKAAKIRTTVIEIIIKVLFLYAGTSTGELLQPENVYKTFFNELAQSKIPSTVLHWIYRLLGIIAQYYPERVCDCMERLLTVYLGVLKKEMKLSAKKPDLPVISGGLHGLNALLTSFSQPDVDMTKELFDYVLLAIQFNEEYTRYATVQAGFLLFTNHASLFGPFIYDNYSSIYESLKKWASCNKGGSKVYNDALAALDVFYRQMGSALCNRAQDDGDRNALFIVFMDFMHKFTSAIQSGEVSRDIALSLKGYGYFAAPCRIFYKDHVNVIFANAIQCSERIFFNEHQLIEDKIRHLPSAIEALASIVDELDEVSEVNMLALENMVIRLIECYPQFHPAHHFLCYRSLIKILVSMYGKGAVFKPFISKIVYQGLLRTCSHVVVFEESNLDRNLDGRKEGLIAVDDQDINKLSYRNYTNLWQNLLEAVKLKELNAIGVLIEDRHAVTLAVYNAIIQAILDILNKLDFSSTKLDSSLDHPTSDVVNGLHAAKPKDFQIFINIVDFFRCMFLEKHLSMFEKWVYKFGYDIICLSLRFPLVSGFYKLLAACFTICSKIQYFSVGIQSDCLPGVHDETKSICLKLFTGYVKEVIVRLAHYKEDLLISCVQLVLTSPDQIVLNHVEAIIPVVEIAFRIGLSYHSIAKDGIEALENWSAKLPVDLLCPLYKRILPLLNDYLKTPVGMLDQLTVKKAPVKSSRRKTFVAVKVVKKRNVDQNSLPEAVHLKHCIVRLLGSLGNSINRLMVDGDSETIAKAAIAWDTSKHLKFDVPFMDLKPSINLDNFLPRVVDLALSSTNRKTKSAASEALHAIVLYMMGALTFTYTKDKQKQVSMRKLFSKIFPVCLQLSCDADQVVKELFKPLTLQLIHWFSGLKDDVGGYTQALLTALLDGVVNNKDCSLRDFSARCIKEFLIWAIKQTTPAEQKKNPFNTKALLRRLYHLNMHPNASFRLGAALTFNNIYVVLREEESLVSIFILELLVNFTESLAMSHRDDQLIGTKEQCIAALDHIKRILIGRAGLLNKPDKQRRLPRGFVKGDLEEAVCWLLKQCSRLETDCRHHCMDLVVNLASHVNEVCSVCEFFQKLLNRHSLNFFITLFEGDSEQSHERTCLQQYPILDDTFPHDRFCIMACKWFDVLLGSMDSYMWVFQHGLLKPAEIFTGSSMSVLMKSLTFFMDEIAFKSFEDVEKSLCTSTDLESDVNFMPWEEVKYNKKKCTVIVRLMDLVTVMTRFHEMQHAFFKEMLPSTFWDLLVDCILQPAILGFDMADVDIMSNLPDKTKSVLHSLANGVAVDVLSMLNVSLHKKVSEAPCLNLMGQLADLSTDAVSWSSPLGHLVCGYEQLHSVQMLHYALEDFEESAYAKTLFSTVWKMSFCFKNDVQYPVDLDGGQLDIARRILKLAFALALPINYVAERIFCSDVVLYTHGDKTDRKGLIFFTLFQTDIVMYFEETFASSINCIMRNVETCKDIVSNVLMAILDNLSSNKTQRKRFGAEVVHEVLQNLVKIKSWWNADASIELKKSALLILKNSLRIDSKVTRSIDHPAFSVVFDMYLNLLSDKNSEIKFKGELLDLLPYFTDLPSAQLLLLKKHLVKLSSIHFPLKSCELPVGSLRYLEYKEVFQKLIKALIASEGSMILEFLIELIFTEEQHVCEEDIQQALEIFVARLPLEKHKDVLDLPYQLFIGEGRHADSVRQCALGRILIPLLFHINKVSFLTFFVKNIKEIVRILQDKSARVFEGRFQSQLISKIGCFKLVEALYSRGTKDELNTTPSVVNMSLCDGSPKTGKEMTQEITKAANNAKKENMQGETEHLELRRCYHCAAYNALVAVIKCTQTELKFYNCFLFTENTVKGDFLWDNLLDATREYKFEIEFKDPLKKKGQLYVIRKNSRQRMLDNRKTDAGENAVGYESYQPVSLHLLASHNLADSSLSEEVSQFDFTSSPEVIISTRYESLVEHAERSSESKLETNPEGLNLELDELNMHECMESLSLVIRHMNRLHLQSGEADKISVWMKNLLAKFAHDNTSKNIKLFIAKLLINNSDVFKTFAQVWLYPMMKLIVDGLCGMGINYFVADLVLTMVSWSPVAIPQDAIERQMASQLLKYLMNNAYYERSAIVKYNIELLKTVVACWKSVLEIPIKVLYEKLTDTEKDGKWSNLGVHFLGIVLSNGLPPYSPVVGLDEKSYFKAVVQSMTVKSQEVYSNASVVVGLVLKYLSETKSSSETFLYEIVSQHLNTFYQSQKDRFLICLYFIQKNYLPISDRFLGRVKFLLGNRKQYGSFRIYSLEIILNRMEIMEDVFVEMKRIELMEMLKIGDDEVQIVCLKIIDKMLTRMKPGELLEILPGITGFINHPKCHCREMMIHVLFWIYDTYREDISDDACKVFSDCKQALLQGLADKDEAVRLTVLDFFGNEARLPAETQKRAIAILHELYSPDSERQFLSYATYLILQMTYKSPDYSRNLFVSPLSDCKFEEYKVNTSWKARHSTFIPLFLDTLVSQPHSSVDDESSRMVAGQLRATLEPQLFTATQEKGRAMPFNWLTQSTLDSSVTSSVDSAMPSTALFTIGLSPKKNVAVGSPQRQRVSNYGQRIETESGSFDVSHLKRRFLKENEEQKTKAAVKKARQQQRRDQLAMEQKMGRMATVTLYRQYRNGDLPDVQIPHSSIIAPLQALAQEDDEIAELLFMSLFNGIFCNASGMTTSEADLYKIEESLNQILAKTRVYFPPVISVVQEICYMLCSKLKVNLENLTSASLVSFQHSKAILILETMILQSSQECKPKDSKRARYVGCEENSVDKNMWFHLSELHKSRGNADISKEIFLHKIGVHPLTCHALEAEIAGDYSKALNFYKQTSTFEDISEDSVCQLEINLWDNAILNCYSQLANWNEMEKLAVEKVDGAFSNLNRVWDDADTQEQYLPYIIRGKLKLIMHGVMDDSLNTFVDSSLHDLQHPERKHILENDYSEELAVLSIIQKDYNRARVYANVCMQRFLCDWTTLSDLAIVRQRICLSSVQKLVEMQNFLHVVEYNASQFESSVCALSKKWEQKFPDKLDSLSLVNDIVDKRCMYFQIFESKSAAIEKRLDMEIDDMTDSLESQMQRSKLSQLLFCVETAVCQNNFPVAFSRLKDSYELISKMDNKKLKGQWCHVYVMTHLKQSKTKDVNSGIATLLKAWNQLRKYDDRVSVMCDKAIELQHFSLHSQIAETLAELLSTHDEDAIEDLAGICQAVNCRLDADMKNILDCLMEYSFAKMNKAVVTASGDSATRFALPHLQLATFCDAHLRNNEESAITKTFPEVIISNLLDAAKYGNSDAVQLFPRLLQIIEKYPEQITLFKNRVREIPCWLFIRWISQMVALLDKPVAFALHEVILSIAKHYPQALIYPFKVSSKGYTFDSSSVGQKNKTAVKEIELELSKLWLVEKFVCALEQLKHPLVVYKQYVEQMVTHIKKKETRTCQMLYKQMYQEIIFDSLDGGSDSLVPVGRYKKLFAQEYGKRFDKEYGKDGRKLLNMSLKAFSDVNDILMNGMRNEQLPKLLKEYSDWLSSFCSSNYTMQIEIPGQYTGFQKPIPDYHTKIAKFGDEVLVLSSIQRPKAITIYGNDCKTYRFLVKGGEDLRLDQRIQQLFQVMNEIYAKDSACAMRHLKLTTYQVVPLNDKLGLIEWVNNTTTLREFIIQPLSNKEVDILNWSKYAIWHWIKKIKRLPESVISPVSVYTELYNHSDKHAVDALYHKVVSEFPSDVLKRAFINLSSSLEAFFTLREHFIISHAVLCISQYIVGIGDRHLSNFMVSLETGGMIGIDFGHAFGSATQILSVPELIPFRLTPQFLNLMEPMRQHGLLRITMLYALNALRKNHTILLNMMDIFIKEPSLDWKEAALRHLDPNSDDDTDLSWYPRQKVDFAKRKLDGHSSRQIMMDELNLRKIKGSAHQAIMDACRGLDSGPSSIIPNKILSVDEQVSHLLDHATDVHILARAYFGLDAFF